MDNFNCKTQAHVRVCEENNLEINDFLLKIFVERLTIRNYLRHTEEMDFSVFTCDDAS